ncbi:hypothetical protein CRENBAI_014915 [Crenichthys baileyi]|uniref:Uncharacterized protein n=1 Tax=Crenichthys baileyi TaxID=28760 RepID=A0AAV9RXW7_9TELE
METKQLICCISFLSRKETKLSEKLHQIRSSGVDDDSLLGLELKSLTAAETLRMRTQNQLLKPKLNHQFPLVLDSILWRRYQDSKAGQFKQLMELDIKDIT